MSMANPNLAEQLALNAFISEIKKMAKDNLIKHLEGRVFNTEKIKGWGEMILNDLGNDLKKKYPDFGFGLFFYISDLTAYASNDNSIYYKDTDITIFETYNTNQYFSEIRIFANNLSKKFLINI